MVNKEVTLTKIINGYEFILMADGAIYTDAIEFCPYSGKECAKGFLWELQHQIYDILIKSDQEVLLTKLFSKGFLTSQFNFSDMPIELQSLLEDKKWFYEKIYANQHEHKGHEFCGGFSAFLDSLYGEKVLPPIARDSILFCPFCGIRLGSSFQNDHLGAIDPRGERLYKKPVEGRKLRGL